MRNLLWAVQFCGASLKVDENSPSVSTVMLWSSSVHLRPEEDRSVMVEMSAGYSSTFKLVPENCVSYMLQPAEKPPLKIFCGYIFSTDIMRSIQSRNCKNISLHYI